MVGCSVLSVPSLQTQMLSPRHDLFSLTMQTGRRILAHRPPSRAARSAAPRPLAAHSRPSPWPAYMRPRPSLLPLLPSDLSWAFRARPTPSPLTHAPHFPAAPPSRGPNLPRVTSFHRPHSPRPRFSPVPPPRPAFPARDLLGFLGALRTQQMFLRAVGCGLTSLFRAPGFAAVAAMSTGVYVQLEPLNYRDGARVEPADSCGTEKAFEPATGNRWTRVGLRPPGAGRGWNGPSRWTLLGPVH